LTVGTAYLRHAGRPQQEANPWPCLQRVGRGRPRAAASAHFPARNGRL